MKPTKDPVVRVKKVKAFPFSVDFKSEKEGAPAIKCEILQLAVLGFMVETSIATLRAGERFTATFTLPVIDAQIVEPVRLVKIYSKPSTDELAPRMWIVEAHFTAAQAPTLEHIEKFLKALERKKT